MMDTSLVYIAAATAAIAVLAAWLAADLHRASPSRPDAIDAARAWSCRVRHEARAWWFMRQHGYRLVTAEEARRFV